MILSQNGMAAGGGVAMPLANMYPDQATTRPSKLKAHAFTSPAALASFTSFSSFFPLSLFPFSHFYSWLSLKEPRGEVGPPSIAQHSAEGNAGG